MSATPDPIIMEKRKIDFAQMFLGARQDGTAKIAYIPTELGADDWELLLELMHASREALVTADRSRPMPSEAST